MTIMVPCFEWPMYARSLTREPVKGVISSESPISNEASFHCLVSYPFLSLLCILKMFHYVSFLKGNIYIYIYISNV